MSLENRAENAMTGFLLLDMFQLLASRDAARKSLPKGSCFLAPETVRNLQNSALAIIAVAASKDPIGSPWKNGEHRLDELGIEQMFGRLRSQSPTAQLTISQYWQASAKDMLKQSKEKLPAEVQRAPSEVLPPLTPDEFYNCSFRAYRAALRLVAFTEDATQDSVQQMYEDWCAKNSVLEDLPLLGDEDEYEEILAAEAAQNNPDTIKDFLNSMQANATAKIKEDDLEIEEDAVPDIVMKDYTAVPDADLLQNAVEAAPEKQDLDEVPPQSPSKGTCSTGLACNLHHALWGLGNAPTEEETFDSLWRLVMSAHEWWPDDGGEGEATPASGKAIHRGLFLRGQARKRRTARAKAKAEQAGKKKQQIKEQKASKKKVAKSKIKLKKAKQITPVEEKLSNYRRQGIGVVLVQQQCHKVRQVDQAKFPGNLLFRADEGQLCRMNVTQCKGIGWPRFLKEVHPFFKAEWLGGEMWRGLERNGEE
eukprot:Skav235943  [mRNA]  locus=scaffold4666:46920:49854:- [translate_table: standard]